MSINTDTHHQGPLRGQLLRAGYLRRYASLAFVELFVAA